MGDLGVTVATDVLEGSMEVLSVQDGMVLYRTAVRDLCTMRTSNLLYPGIKIVLVLEGETQLSYGALRLHLRAAEPAHCGAMVALARTDRFMRQWHVGRHERKLVLTLTPQWLEQAGVLQGQVAEFTERHLAVAPWRPSARTLAQADQLHRGCPLPEHLHALWYQSRCMDIVLEALASVEAATAPEGVAPVPRTGARQHVRLAVLRDWLITPAADGMDVAAIARYAGMMPRICSVTSHRWRKARAWGVFCVRSACCVRVRRWSKGVLRSPRWPAWPVTAAVRIFLQRFVPTLACCHPASNHRHRGKAWHGMKKAPHAGLG